MNLCLKSGVKLTSPDSGKFWFSSDGFWEVRVVNGEIRWFLGLHVISGFVFFVLNNLFMGKRGFDFENGYKRIV